MSVSVGEIGLPRKGSLEDFILLQRGLFPAGSFNGLQSQTEIEYYVLRGAYGAIIAALGLKNGICETHYESKP